MAVKTALYLPWLKNPNVSVYGLAYATNIAYLVALALDILFLFIVTRKTEKEKTSQSEVEKGVGK